MTVPEDIEARILEKATHVEEAVSILGEEDVLSDERSTKMQKAAGFRNVLVHQYGNDIDDTEVYEHLQTELEWLVAFLREVKAYLAGP